MNQLGEVRTADGKAANYITTPTPCCTASTPEPNCTPKKIRTAGSRPPVARAGRWLGEGGSSVRGGVQIEVEGTRVTELVGVPFLPCWYAMGKQPPEVEVISTEEEEGGAAWAKNKHVYQF